MNWKEPLVKPKEDEIDLSGADFSGYVFSQLLVPPFIKLGLEESARMHSKSSKSDHGNTVTVTEVKAESKLSVKEG